MKEAPYSFRITNVVCHGNIGRKVDLDELYSKILRSYSEFNFSPLLSFEYQEWCKRFVFRLKEPKGVFLLFESGKFVITGCKDERNAMNVAMRVKKELKRYGLEIEQLNVRVNNIVVHGNFKRAIKVEKAVKVLQKIYNKLPIYEPDQFPAIIHKYEDGSSLLLFPSGTVILSGLKDKKRGEERLNNLYRILEDNNVFLSEVNY